MELAKLGDFGVAHLSGTRGAGSTLTQTGTIVGTPGYLAPEQLRSAKVDARTDLFGLGCILFECLTGRAAFEAETLLALLAKIALDPTPRVRDARADLPRELDALVTQLLEKEASARPASAAEVLSALAKLHAASDAGRLLSDVPTIVGTAERGWFRWCSAPAPMLATEPCRNAPRSTRSRRERGRGSSCFPMGRSSACSPRSSKRRPSRRCAQRDSRWHSPHVLGERPIAVVTARVAVSSGIAVSEIIDRALPQVLSAPPRRDRARRRKRVVARGPLRSAARGRADPARRGENRRLHAASAARSRHALRRPAPRVDAVVRALSKNASTNPTRGRCW